jgi:glyoxylase I family protein
MQISHFLHAAVVVSDLAQAEHFYGTVLGLPKVDRALRFPGAWYQLGAGQIHLIAELTAENPGFASPQASAQAAKWGRNAHLALAVVDLQAAKHHLQAHGYEVQLSASGRSALFVKDPDGNVIELSE